MFHSMRGLMLIYMYMGRFDGNKHARDSLLYLNQNSLRPVYINIFEVNFDLQDLKGGRRDHQGVAPRSVFNFLELLPTAAPPTLGQRESRSASPLLGDEHPSGGSRSRSDGGRVGAAPRWNGGLCGWVVWNGAVRRW